MAHGGIEVEIKLAVASAVAGRRLLREAGFRVIERRAFEANTLFDTPDLRLMSGDSMLRVREIRRTAKLTYKSAGETGRHKRREEIEVTLSDAGKFRSILERMGFAPAFRYEKYRTEYRGQGTGWAMLDETPIGVYLELEGSARWIDRTARRLGFSELDYITLSYGRLYLKWCEDHACKPGHMVFHRAERPQKY